jgi:hypothetical protein
MKIDAVSHKEAPERIAGQCEQPGLIAEASC